MNSEFQILRWGIPGWIFLLTVITLWMSLYQFSIRGIVGIFENPSALGGIAALFVAMGVPIGYIIYQVYFFVKWTLGNQKVFIVVEGVSHFYQNCTVYKKRTKINHDWKVIENYIDRLMTLEVPKRNLSQNDIKRRNDWISNRTSRLHGLGASFWAIVLGIIAFLLSNAAKLSIILNYFTILTGVCFLLLFVVIYRNYYVANVNAFGQFNSLICDILKADLKSNNESTLD